jgi:hypothetical protein
MTYAYLFLSGFAFFLLWLSIFMYFENRKFGDNQFTVKLLPAPSTVKPVPQEDGAGAYASGQAAFSTRMRVPDAAPDLA